jgi:uncharacterized membrane protein
MTKEQARLLRSAINYPGWQGYMPGSKVYRTLKTLEEHGLIVIDRQDLRFILARTINRR